MRKLDIAFFSKPSLFWYLGMKYRERKVYLFLNESFGLIKVEMNKCNDTRSATSINVMVEVLW